MDLKPFGLVLLLPLFAVEDVTKKDEARLQRTWSAVKAVRKGQEREKEETVRRTIVIQDDSMEFRFDGELVQRVTFKLDPMKKPRTIDIRDERAERSFFGIYELDGEMLRICWNSEKWEAPRPTDFQAMDQPLWHLLVLKRKAR